MASSIFFTVEVQTRAGNGAAPTDWSEWERYEVARTAQNRAIIVGENNDVKTRVCRVHVLDLDLERDPDNVKGVGVA